MSKSMFFNSSSGDRIYNASHFAEYFKDFFTNGVFYNKSNALQCTAGGGLTVNVQAGRANINGYCFIADDVLSITLPAAEATERYDAIVLRLDSSSARSITATYIKGTAGAGKPSITRSGNTYDIALCYVKVGAGVSTITAADIEDTRFNSTLCGIVTQAVSTIDVQTLYNDMKSKLYSFYADKQTQFIAWFNQLNAVLSGDVAANLAGQIETLENNLGILYNATGDDDVTKLNGIINGFLSDTTDDKKATVKVSGDIFADGGNNTTVNGVSYSLCFNNATKRRVKIDFTDCAKITAGAPIFANSQVEIVGLNFESDAFIMTSNGARFERCILRGKTGGIKGTHVYAKDCKINVLSTSAQNIVAGVETGGYLENCDVYAQSATGNANGAGYGCFAVYSNSADFPLNIIGGSMVAYISASDTRSNEAIGIYTPAGSQSILNVRGARVPLVSKSGFKQTGSIKINNGYGSIIGCAVYTDIQNYSAQNVHVAGNAILNMSKGIGA